MFEFRVKRLVQLIIVIVLLAVLGRALYLYCSYKFNLMMGYSNDCRPKSNSRLNMEKSDWSNGGVFDCVFSKDNVNFGRDFIVMGLTCDNCNILRTVCIFSYAYVCLRSFTLNHACE